MGKALLFIVAAIGATSLQTIVQANSVQNRSAVQQVVYQDDMIAYQAARAGYNVAYAMIHEATSLAEGVALVNSTATGLRGEYLGGEYRVTAGFVGGETVTIQANGYYGGRWNRSGEYVGRYVAGRYMEPSHHFVGDDRQSVVFNADRSDGRPRRLTAHFMKSAAGYCSAVFTQRFTPGVAPADQPAPEMMFFPGNTRDGDGSEFSIDVMPGTQLNFFIAVDKNCSVTPNVKRGIHTMSPANEAAWIRNFNDAGRANPATVAAYLQQFDHIHNALDLDVSDLANLRESPWAMIEQSRNGGERWRIGWEDIHNTSWLSGNTPRTSLRLTKEFGYNGAGWGDQRVDGFTAERTDGTYRVARDTDASGQPILRSDGQPYAPRIPSNQPDGYRDVADTSAWPDFEDQVIEVVMTPIEGSPLEVTVPPRPVANMPDLVNTNGGCPPLKLPMDRASVRDVGRTDRVCADPERVSDYLAAGLTRAVAPPTSNGRVTICHRGRTRSVTQNRLNRHINHGDARGACNG